MKLFELKNLYYAGEPLETGGTSIAGKGGGAAPGVKWLRIQLKNGDVVLDYGAGKFARNADYLRSEGFKTYAYDPFNFNGKAGWEPGEVSSKLPSKKFDAAFSCYVLNVVPQHVEAKIISAIEALGKRVIHITRGTDVSDMVKSALARRDKVVWPFFLEHFWEGKQEPTAADITPELIAKLCKFGVQTSKGFQRIPALEDYGYILVKSGSYKVYVKA